ncbi:MAG: UbiA family prenyltransferase, partial [Acidobacteriota bacterium]|nr:UbiA family prenyltransferase [Acidobacteriota bacterium]
MGSRTAEISTPEGGRGPGLTQTVRAAEWWEFKLSPILATAYATAFLLNLSITSLWPALLLALAALVPGAAYVSVINDLTDIEDDLACGKPNRLVGRARAFVASVLACCVAPGVVVAFCWRGDPLLLSLYLAAWIAFTLYSLPPARLKARGMAGLLADACGAHLFPTLVVTVLVFRWGGLALDRVWLASVAVWSLCLGLRGNLWHQLSDLPNDQKSGLRTFARRHKITRLRGLGNFVIFPAEAAAFAVMLWRAGSLAAVALLCLYALLELLRGRLWRVKPCVVVPGEGRRHIVMHEYYEVLFPAAFVLASSLRHPLDALVLAVHLLLFPRRARRLLRDVTELFAAPAADAWRRGEYGRWRLKMRAAAYAGRAGAMARDPRLAVGALRRRLPAK